MKSCEKILKDEHLDQQLREKGFVTFPFLNENAVSEMVARFHAMHTDTPEGFYATAHSRDLDFRMANNELIKSYFVAPMESLLHECQILGGSFIGKSGGDKGILPPHQDWNIVDEQHHRSFNLWVPLVDVTPENGTIRVLPGSHTLPFSYRGPQIMPAFVPHFEWVKQHLQPLSMKAGEALLYDHRLIHDSGPNQTDKFRLAAVFGVIPQAAELRYYYPETINGQRKIAEYASSLDFFFTENIEEGPAGLQKIKEIDYDFRDFTMAELEGCILIDSALAESNQIEQTPTQENPQTTEYQNIFQKLYQFITR